MLPFDSPSLYQLSYRGSNCEEATAIRSRRWLSFRFCTEFA